MIDPAVVNAQRDLDLQGDPSAYDIDYRVHAQAVLDMAKERDEARAENTIMRGILANHKTANPCIYCGAESMGKCPKGFPGCGQADDILIADDELAQRLAAKIGLLTEALRECEWGGYRYIGMATCPCCSNEQSEGHQSDCYVGQAMKA
jgi:hypothetical protein